MGRARAVALASALGALLAGCATAQIRESRVVTGQVTDASGRPVAKTPVVIVARSLELVTTRMQYEERGRRELKASTDTQGRYRMELVPESLGNNFFLFFYDKTGFDRVKYRRPEPVDITPRLKSDRMVAVNQILQFQVTWPEVERQIAFYGPDSDKGHILLRHGLPEKRETSGERDPASEAWWYYSDGVSYYFTADKLTRTQEFTPILGATPKN